MNALGVFFHDEYLSEFHLLSKMMHRSYITSLSDLAMILFFDLCLWNSRARYGYWCLNEEGNIWLREIIKRDWRDDFFSFATKTRPPRLARMAGVVAGRR
ncbi:MAG: hypothetical protein JSV31_24335 [Desulfobacterales bacterium]|nr:MAG: hypothetical protein JSV31_24335 [Desulfobacterales bacterium]